MPPKRANEKEKRVKQASARSMERALREERLALAAIAKCFILESPDPGRLLARLEAMTRSAQQSGKTTVAIQQSLLDAVKMIRNAINRELGKPQELMDPNVGHVMASRVDRLVGPDGNPISFQQLGLMSDGDLGDVITAHEEQTATIFRVHDQLVKVLRRGPATDKEIYRRYILHPDTQPQSQKALLERRKELTVSGRIREAGRHKDEPIWGLVEQ
jgi:hypothetical protein